MTRILEPNESRDTRALGTYLGDGVIVYKGKPSTGVRLHEIAHKTLGHKPGVMSIKAFVDKELAAEAFSFEHRGKPITHRIAAPVLGELVDDWNLSPSEATSIVISRLNQRGIKVGRKARRDLNWFAHGLAD